MNQETKLKGVVLNAVGSNARFEVDESGTLCLKYNPTSPVPTIIGTPCHGELDFCPVIVAARGNTIKVTESGGWMFVAYDGKAPPPTVVWMTPRELPDVETKA